MSTISLVFCQVKSHTLTDAPTTIIRCEALMSGQGLSRWDDRVWVDVGNADSKYHCYVVAFGENIGKLKVKEEVSEIEEYRGGHDSREGRHTGREWGAS